MGEHVRQLARLRAATAPGLLPRDVGMWALEILRELEPAAERVERRNALLREAAGRVSGSRWARARRIEQEIRALGMHPRLRERAADDGVRALVARALDVDPDAPCSVRQFSGSSGRTDMPAGRVSGRRWNGRDMIRTVTIDLDERERKEAAAARRFPCTVSSQTPSGGAAGTATGAPARAPPAGTAARPAGRSS